MSASWGRQGLFVGWSRVYYYGDIAEGKWLEGGLGGGGLEEEGAGAGGVSCGGVEFIVEGVGLVGVEEPGEFGLFFFCEGDGDFLGLSLADDGEFNGVAGLVGADEDFELFGVDDDLVGEEGNDVIGF